MKNLKLLTVAFLSIIMFSGFSFGSFGDSDEERRAERIAESETALQLLFKEEPKAKDEVLNAYGFATFKNYGMSMMMMSADGGRGLAYSFKTKKTTFMNMASGGMGMGLGAKEYYSVFIFDNEKVFNDFVEDGWEMNSEIDASIKSNDDGETMNESYTIAKGVKLYKVTQKGAIVQMNIHGSKYWKCRDLN
jgi:lipid-binding SYLF domain-containing protein